MQVRPLNPRLITLLFFAVLVTVTYVQHNSIFERDITGWHAWRQTYTQQNIDCFYEEDNNILHPRFLARGMTDGIRRQEFPIFQWLIAQSYFLFGQSLLVTRIWCFTIGLISILGFFLLVKRLTKVQATVFAATTMFAFSPYFFYYMMNPLPDLLALCAGAWAMYFYVRAFHDDQPQMFFVATVLLSLAALAKLPYILLAGIPLGILIDYLKTKKMRPQRMWLIASALATAPVFWWYSISLPEMKNNAVLSGTFAGNPGDVNKFFDSVYGNLTDSLPRLFLGYAGIAFFVLGFVLLLVKFNHLFRSYLPYTLAFIFFILYFLYEAVPISTVHDYYMLPFLPFLVLIAAVGWQFTFRYPIGKPIAILALICMPYVANKIIAPRWDPTQIVFNSDWYKHRDELRAIVPDSSKVIMGNDVSMSIIPYYVHKRGWSYVDQELTRDYLQGCINNDAGYLYTDSPFTLADSTLRPLFSREIAVYGSVHVFALKTNP